MLGVEQREDRSVSVMEEIKGMEEMESAVISPVTDMLSVNVVAVKLLGWEERGVKYWLELSSTSIPSPTLFRAI